MTVLDPVLEEDGFVYPVVEELDSGSSEDEDMDGVSDGEKVDDEENGDTKQNEQVDSESLMRKEEDMVDESSRILNTTVSWGISVVPRDKGEKKIGSSVCLSQKSYRELWKLSFNVNYDKSMKRVGDYSVSVCLEAERKAPWWFAGVYGPVVYGNIVSFWDELAGLSAICGENWCVGGDFNVVRRVYEKLNSRSNTRSMKMFDSMIRELKLVDPKLHNGRFTWSNYRHKPICCRLDRFLYTPSWFDNTWLEHKDFSSNFQILWDSAKIKKWSRQVFGNRKMHKQLLERRLFALDKLEEGGAWNENLQMERSKVKGEWQQIVLEEERSVWFKVKCQWAKEGDANSKLFHGILSARKARNFISRLEEEDGTVLENEVDIEKAIVGFYSSLYSAISRICIGVDGIS
ncbi:uncharacterized protein LOC133802004 [Humulus lupulus]|uniref:uncharacterized protein LOC133802004 n=1 Tax=Humulus lupulus TaxID=3486 RepID=UPI002B40C452|nr:uncharacterized protein LOC133802004 [Humulus lupulus]